MNKNVFNYLSEKKNEVVEWAKNSKLGRKTFAGALALTMLASLPSCDEEEKQQDTDIDVPGVVITDPDNQLPDDEKPGDVQNPGDDTIDTIEELKASLKTPEEIANSEITANEVLEMYDKAIKLLTIKDIDPDQKNVTDIKFNKIDTIPFTVKLPNDEIEHILRSKYYYLFTSFDYKHNDAITEVEDVYLVNIDFDIYDKRYPGSWALDRLILIDRQAFETLLELYGLNATIFNPSMIPENTLADERSFYETYYNHVAYPSKSFSRQDIDKMTQEELKAFYNLLDSILEHTYNQIPPQTIETNEMQR